MKKMDINNKPFDEGTLLKLDIFRKCFREWFPVFIHNPYIEQIVIYDMFAGSGYDSNGVSGSPIILLEEAKGNENNYCKILSTKKKPVCFGFNEKVKKKIEALQNAVDSELNRCKENCVLSNCVFKNNIFYRNEPFEKLVDNEQFQSVLSNNKIAKFVLLDQYGFSQITKDVFLQLVSSPHTDFIFFVSSSSINRFKTMDAVKLYFDTNKIHFEEKRPKECHRIIADYYRSLVPNSKEYYIHHFTIQKGSNYYGLILGTNHSLGMEKFVKVCWQEDSNSGESNCDIENDFPKDSLFYDPENTTKKVRIKEQLEKLILAGNFANNKEGLKWTLLQGCEPKLFVDVITDLKNNNRIHIDGKFNKQSSNIHKVDEYKISCDENDKDRMD